LSIAAGVTAAGLLWVQAAQDPAAPLFAMAMIASVAVPFIAVGLRRQGWIGDRSDLSAIGWLPDGRWQLLQGSRWIDAALRRESRVGSRWVWLRWDVADRTRSMLLTRADLPAADLRRLIVRLRLGAEGSRLPVSRRQHRLPEIPGA
jgi:hypothetical protein